MDPARVAAVQLDLQDERWLTFVSSRPETLPFHHPAWAQLVGDAYGFDQFALSVLDGDNRIVGGVPVVDVKSRLGRRRWVSLPFTDHCPPLVGERDAARLLNAIELARTGAGVASVEVRGRLQAATVETDAVIHVLPLDDDPALTERHFRASVRRNIRAGVRRGVVIRRAEARRDLVQSFYDLQVQTRRRLGLPAQPRRFFASLWDRIFDRELGFLLLAHVGRRPVAGAVFLTWNGTITFKYGASDAAFWSYRPNHVLFAEAIQWACTNRFRRFDFGRTSTADEGLRRFKLSWGPGEAPLVYTMLGPPRRPHSQWSKALLARAIRRSPSWVVRASGELLYRYEA